MRSAPLVAAGVHRSVEVEKAGHFHKVGLAGGLQELLRSTPLVAVEARLVEVPGVGVGSGGEFPG